MLKFSRHRFSMNGQCTAQQSYAFRSNKSFVLTYSGAPWPFAIASRSSDALGHWVQYCSRAFALSVAKWAEIAYGLLEDQFRIVCGFLAD